MNPLFTERRLGTERWVGASTQTNAKAFLALFDETRLEGLVDPSNFNGVMILAMVTRRNPQLHTRQHFHETDVDSQSGASIANKSVSLAHDEQ